jgi:hypothetical protein
VILSAAEIISLVLAVFAVASAVSLAIYTSRSRSEKSARGALVDELGAQKAANERLGHERDSAVAENVELKQQVAVLEARTDLSALSEQIAETTKATVTAIVTTLDDHDKRSQDRHDHAESRTEKRHSELLGAITGLSAVVRNPRERNH